MDNAFNEFQHDWSVILDELKQEKSITSDAKLAEWLGVTRGYICSVRKGRKGVSLELAKMIFADLGRSFEAENLERLFVPSKVLAHTANLKAIRNFVISRASGYCQLCGVQAPFKSPDGKPYLELHHVTPRQDGGDDSTSNLVALCPNCHRKMEISPKPSDVSKLELLVKQYGEADAPLQTLINLKTPNKPS